MKDLKKLERKAEPTGVKADDEQPGNHHLFGRKNSRLRSDINQTVKFIAARERPYFHARWPDNSAAGSDDRLSFFSGHTSLTFTLAVAGGTVATMRGYRLAPLVWVVGLALATATAYLRIAADKHYMSDVLVGGVVAGAVGVGVPLLMHPSRSLRIPRGMAASASREGASVALTWIF